MNPLLATLVIGTGATAIADLWGLVRRALLGIPFPDYGLVGRWFAYLPRGRFRHDPIAASASVQGERYIGWVAHYLIGIAYAGLLIAIWGVAWLQNPTPGPALLVGIGTVAAPFLVMQPGMGAGVAASRTPHPNAVRLQSLLMHAAFGLGLYVAGLLALYLAGAAG